MISIVVAHSNNNVIGKDSKMPWDLPDDMEFFKNLTTDNIVIMGRKTYQCIGKPLENRINIVISRSRSKGEDLSTNAPLYNVSSIDDAINLAQTLSKTNHKEIFIIGGQTIYEQTIDIADIIYITKIYYDYEGDKFFPEFDESNYDCVVTKSVDDNIPHKFMTYTKTKPNTK